MRVALVTPWENAWVPLYQREFEARGHDFVRLKAPARGYDVVLHGWTSTQPVRGARNIMCLRRYELYSGGLQKIDWAGIDHLVCVNAWIAEITRNVFQEAGVKTPVSVIYNTADPEKWSFRERSNNHRVGMACHVHPKKNLPLALQVMAHLPDHFELHIAGAVQDGCTAEYLNHLAKLMKRKVYLYGHVNDLNGWWEQMGCCLSTSISEGNPNNVIEAMAKGIKPVVHWWPGADDQFEDTFLSAEEAAAMIEGPYDSKRYREAVLAKYSEANIRKVVDLCEA